MVNKAIFILAPLDDVTDTVFRQMVAACAAPDFFFTEFVNVDGLQSRGREKLLPKLKFSQKEDNLVAQIWGKTPENYYKTAKQIVDGSLAREANNGGDINYCGVDINMGCPDKAICKNGCCAALINNRGLTDEILSAVREGVGPDFPVSVKTRLGYSEVDFTWHEQLLKHKLNMLTIHGRTAKQMSVPPADWDAIEKIRIIRDTLCPSTLIIGNGDVKNISHGLELVKKHQVDGAMIGRGIFADPFAFSNKNLWTGYSNQEKLQLFLKHVELFENTWKNNERKQITLNKFCKMYINGFDGATELRVQLMQTTTIAELKNLINKIFAGSLYGKTS